MAASGFTPISLYYSTTAAAVPTSGNLANGELGLNIADMKLYAKNSAGTVTLLASSGGAAGTVSSVAVSGGTTGLTTSGGPITTSGTITLAGTVATTNGGTGLTSFTSGGVVYASSTSALATGSALVFDGTNLGIGTSSPASKLHLSSSASTAQTITAVGTAAYASVSFVNTTTGYGYDIGFGGSTSVAPNSFYVYGGSSASVKMQIDATGNMGLGVTPSAWFSTRKAFQIGSSATILGDPGSIEIRQNALLNASGSEVYITSNYASLYLQAIGQHRWYNAPSGTAGNAITFTQAMTLDASGRLLIGATSTQGNNSKFQVSGGTEWFGSQGANGPLTTLSFYNTNSSGFQIATMDVITGANFYEGIIRWQTKDVGGTVAERARISSAGGFSVGTTADPGAGAIYATGNITAYYSDARLKTVSGKIENALEKVAQLSGVYYTNNDIAKSFGYTSDEVQVGVLAQEVGAVLPEIVKAAPFDLDENGNSKSGENYKTVQYERLVPLLIEAINELRAEVKALKGA